MVKIGKLSLSDEKPAICVPIMQKDAFAVLKMAEDVKAASPDIVELRLDALSLLQTETAESYGRQKETKAKANEPLSPSDENEAKAISLIGENERKTDDKEKDLRRELSGLVAALARKLGDIPLLCTLRTQKEGGLYKGSSEAYLSLCELLLTFPENAALDVEAISRPEAAAVLIAAGKRAEKPVIASFHDFSQTPSDGEILRRLSFMQQLHPLVVKMAVMPKCSEDVSRIKEAGRRFKETYPHTPLILIAMGELGRISRIKPAEFHSVLTFAGVGKTSAPGQIPVEELRGFLKD